ncbi:MAG: hypothetical protein CML19_08110 [Pusillimonas sp.]|nr:hypothetical protein [Parvibaculum sp.]MBC42176.1 hypothetical protein [Pusillimonas sp.]|tara:strand:+ start:845 stop:1084 length:240 start_codon:yes stop_codon:yes gene_type:complete
MINQMDFELQAAKEATETMLDALFENDDVSKGAIYAGVLAVVLRDLRDEAPTTEAMLAVISIALASSAFDNEETEQFFC